MSAVKAPAKKWCVQGPELHEGYRSRSAAYDAVNQITGAGHMVTVNHWENGRWVLYEKIEPAKETE